MTCKRSEQCDHADICRFAKSTEYNLLGGSCFTPKDPQTNEEWLKHCNTEQLADVIADFYLLGYTHGHNKMDITSRTKWFEWLKQPHTTE